MMRQQQSDEDQGIDELLLQEYEHFLSNKAEGTIDAYVRTTRHVMEWVEQRPGNGGRFHPQQLTKTAVEVYLASLEQEEFSLNHRAREIDYQQFCSMADGGKGTAPAEPDQRNRSPFTARVGSS